MEASRHQLQSYKANNQGSRPVLEEFIPLKHPNLEGPDQKTANISDKANRIISSPKLALDNKQRNGGGAFLPFATEHNSIQNNLNIRALPDLALASSDRSMEDKKCVESDNGVSGSRSENSSKGGNVVGDKATDSQAPTTPTSGTTHLRLIGKQDDAGLRICTVSLLMPFKCLVVLKRTKDVG
ncbi:Myb family transcription factor EFM [Bienertia sinuspersici]